MPRDFVYLLSESTLLILYYALVYYALVHSSLSYGILVWGNTFSWYLTH